MNYKVNTVTTYFPNTYPYPEYYSSTTYASSTEIKTMHLSGSFDYNGKKIYIKEVIYSKPATIVIWNDGEKTVCKCSKGDTYSREAGLAMCILKRLVGPTNVHDIFSDWVEEKSNRVSIKDVRKKNR